MVKIDIIGDFRSTSDAIMDNENLELFIIDRITKAEDFQEALIVFPPEKKKFRWKSYSADDANILYEYVEKGGILILIPPFNSAYLEKLSEIYEKFKISPIFQQENLLAHINAHMINFGKDGKLPLKKYIHFLLQEKESLEVIIEGNFIPIFALQFIGEGAVILYGLGSKLFWQEDLLLIFKYLKEEYDYFWVKSELTERDLENILKCSRKEIHQKIQDDYIHTFIKKKRFNEFLEIKNPTLKEMLIQNIQSNTIEDEFKDLSGKFLAKKYRDLYKLLHKEHPELLKKLQKFIYMKVIDHTLTEKTFNILYESDLLPPEAAYLLVFYLDPKDPENYKKFKNNLSKLIEWNKKEKIFDEKFLKELAWEHL